MRSSAPVLQPRLKPDCTQSTAPFRRIRPVRALASLGNAGPTCFWWVDHHPGLSSAMCVLGDRTQSSPSPSQCSRPGSSKCTWVSMSPGDTTASPTSSHREVLVSLDVRCRKSSKYVTLAVSGPGLMTETILLSRTWTAAGDKAVCVFAMQSGDVVGPPAGHPNHVSMVPVAQETPPSSGWPPVCDTGRGTACRRYGVAH